jgi:hypothetical protein
VLGHVFTIKNFRNFLRFRADLIVNILASLFPIVEARVYTLLEETDYPINLTDNVTRRLDARFSPQNPWLNSGRLQLRFVFDEILLEQISFPSLLSFLLIIVILPLLHIHL